MVLTDALFNDAESGSDHTTLNGTLVSEKKCVNNVDIVVV
jgi:hypothetical protein